MEDMIQSPVPYDQRPIEQFIELRNSYFFSWPVNSSYNFFRNLILIWIISIPVFVVIMTGSYSIRNNLFLLISISLLSSSIVPLLLIFRQFLGWNYIYERLLSEIIAYEETDWHDGQIWKKPEIWKSRDKLVAKEEVLPIISKIKISLITLLIFFIITSSSFILVTRS